MNPKEPVKPSLEKPAKAASTNKGAKSSAKAANGVVAPKAPAKAAERAVSASAKAPIKAAKKESVKKEEPKKDTVKKVAASKAQPTEKPAPKATKAPKAATAPAKPPTANGGGVLEKAVAAKGAASAAREAAQAKRAAVQQHPASRGSIFANVGKEGQVLQSELPEKKRRAQGMLAAVMHSGVAAFPEGEQANTGMVLAAGGAPPEEAEVPGQTEKKIDEETIDSKEEKEPGLVDTAMMPTFGRKGKAVQKSGKRPWMWPKKLRRETPFRQRVTRFLAAPPLHVLGGFFYLLGFMAECRVLQVWRFVRDTVVFGVQLLAWLLGGVFRALGHFLKSFFQGFAEPFVRLKAGLANTRRVMVEERQKAGGNPAKAAVAYFTEGVKNHSHLVANLIALALPVLATGVLVFVVWNVLETNYGLEVTVQGETIGYIQDETVLEDAKAMLRGRLRLAGDQNMEDWKFDSTMALARTNSFTSKDQLVNEMLRSGTADIVEGTGLYVDGNLVAVTTEGDQLKDYLDDVLKERAAQAEPGAKVSFVRNVQCDPALDDVFLRTSVQTYDDLMGVLTQTVNDEVRYTVQEGDNLGDIARSQNILFETLVARNPALEGEDIDYQPDEGEVLLIEEEKPFLQVQTTVRQVYTEELPFPVVEEETSDKAQGYRRVTQSGVPGVQEVQDDLVYIDGELVDQIRIEEETKVITEPVEEVVSIGTFDVTDRQERDFSPVYTWPVPDYIYSSRGGGPGQGHRGRDINAPEGTPIYAANAGIVVTAGWHYSYGNHVVIQHPDGLVTLYAHASFLAVTAGQEVKQNQYIANVGNTGFSFGNHLHLEFQQPGGGLLNSDDYVVAPHGYGRG